MSNQDITKASAEVNAQLTERAVFDLLTRFCAVLQMLDVHVPIIVICQHTKLENDKIHILAEDSVSGKELQKVCSKVYDDLGGHVLGKIYDRKEVM